MNRHLEWILNPGASVLRKECGDWTLTQGEATGRGHVEMKAEAGGGLLQAKKPSKPPGAGRQAFPSGPSQPLEEPAKPTP